MRLLFLALLSAISLAPMDADAQAPGTETFLCRPGDDGCARFVGDAKRSLPKRGGVRQPVFIGASVFMLTPWQAERERRCLALAGWAEARGEGADAMAAVMWVIANRAASASQPSLPCRIVVAAGQFEPFSAEPPARKKAAKAAKAEKPQRKPQQAREQVREQAREEVTDSRAEARRLLAEIRRQARVIRAGGMPSWPKPRLFPDQEALRLAKAIAWNLNDDDLPDPTARASLFYSPSTQSMLGRQKPDWAEARLRTASIGDHSFFRYPPLDTDDADTQVAEVGQ